MGGMDAFEVDYEELAGEVSGLYEVSDAIGDAVDAGLSAQQMSENAFGLLCVGMVPPAQLAQSAAIIALTAEARAYEAAALNLRYTAEDYAATDALSASRHRALMRKAMG